MKINPSVLAAISQDQTVTSDLGDHRSFCERTMKTFSGFVIFLEWALNGVLMKFKKIFKLNAEISILALLPKMIHQLLHRCMTTEDGRKSKFLSILLSIFWRNFQVTMQYVEMSQIVKSTSRSCNQHVGVHMEIVGTMKTQLIAWKIFSMDVKMMKSINTVQTEKTMFS